jgi:HPt (histidine-containing phosphotransfer) domain-containing protein
MDGLEASLKTIEAYRKHSAAVGTKVTPPPMIALTANVMTNDIEIYRKAGMLDTVGKPFTSQELWSCLIKYIPVKSFTAVDNRRNAVESKKSHGRILGIFAQNNTSTFANIFEALEEADFKTAHRLAHSLKSNAGYISEATLQRAAANLETLLTESPPPDAAIATQMKIIEVELARILDEIAHVNKPAPPPCESTVVITDEIDVSAAAEVFEELDPLLRKNCISSLKLTDKLREVSGTDELIKLIEGYKFKQAADLLALLRQGREGES